MRPNKGSTALDPNFNFSFGQSLYLKENSPASSECKEKNRKYDVKVDTHQRAFT